MATEEYSIGYEEGYQDGWNAALEPEPQAEKKGPAGYLKSGYYFLPNNPIPRSEIIPRKEWVGLTDAEAGNLFKDTDWVNDDWGHLSYAKAIEAKLKEKNT